MVDGLPQILSMKIKQYLTYMVVRYTLRLYPSGREYQFCQAQFQWASSAELSSALILIVTPTPTHPPCLMEVSLTIMEEIVVINVVAIQLQCCCSCQHC